MKTDYQLLIGLITIAVAVLTVGFGPLRKRVQELEDGLVQESNDANLQQDSHLLEKPVPELRRLATGSNPPQGPVVYEVLNSIAGSESTGLMIHVGDRQLSSQEFSSIVERGKLRSVEIAAGCFANAPACSNLLVAIHFFGVLCVCEKVRLS